MADARVIVVRDSTGAPVTAGVSIVEYRDRSGTPRTPPAITHRGSGAWVFTPTDADELVGTVALVDCGAGNLPRRASFALHLPQGTNQFFVVHVETPAGLLWSGAAPTVGQYIDSGGNARTPPPLSVVAGAYLYALTPSAADVVADTQVRIDGPAGSAVPFWTSSTVPAFASTPPPAPAPANPPPVPTIGTVVTAPIRWQDYQPEVAPPWLRQGAGEVWLRGLGDAKDALELRARESVKARLPTEAPLDALTRIGGDRGGLERGVVETEAAWRARLRAAWDVWPWAGTPTGVLRALWYAGYSSVVLLTGTGEAHTLDGSLNVVTQAAGGTIPSGFWNCFRVLFVAPLPAAWVPTPPANDSIEVGTLRRLVKTWKPGHAIFEDMVVVQGNVWGFPLSRLWGAGGLNWGGATTVWTPD